MSDRILMSSPDVGALEEKYLIAAFRSGWIAPLGPDVDAFEREVADRVGVAHAVALSSGTAALHLGLLGLGVCPGDTVITATMTFAATANAITYTGARPHFVDCDPGTGNIDPGLLLDALRRATRADEHVAAIVPVDLFGKTADYTSICAIAEEFDVPVLADAAESFGAWHKGRPAGSFGAASAVSFNGNKIMTTSGGGMLLTEDARLAARARYLATQARMPVAHYEHQETGYNYRLSNLLAALGRAQLARFDEMMKRRRQIREVYRTLVSAIPGVEIFGADDAEDNCWLTSVLIDQEVTGWDASRLREALSSAQVESRPLWKPMHLQPVFRQARATVNGSAEQLFETGLTLPSGSALTDSQIERVCRVISTFAESCS
jgi:dTDP-4-amino-4,6-dideoxygalactose transaminase